MHPEISRSRPGKCPKCGDMKLVLRASLDARPKPTKLKTFLPLIIIFSLLLLTSIGNVFGLNHVLSNGSSGSVHNAMNMGFMGMGHTASSGTVHISIGTNLMTFMSSFMAGTFIVFAAFKLLDIKGFAQGFSSYDLIASRFTSYGYAYPFIELLLGFFYLFNFQPSLTNSLTLIITAVSATGVLIKLSKKQTFQCACLGTFFDFPLTNVTLFEDIGMAAMAIVMLGIIR
jgi:hypothetical protein